MKKLNVAIIGLGRMGKFHLDVLSSMKNVKIVCALSTNKKTLEKKKTLKKYKIKRNYTKLSEMLNNENIDAAFVQPSVQYVYKISKVLLKNHIHCLIEKPPGLNLVQARNLKKLIIKNKLIHLIGLQRRFYSNILKISNYHSKLGKLYSINVEAPEKFDEKKNKKKFIQQVLNKWIYVNGIHVIDLINFFAKSELKKVFSISRSINEKIKNSFHAVIKYKNNIVVNYISNWKSIGGWSIKLYFENGVVIIQPLEKTLVKFNNGKEIDLNISKIDQKFKHGLYLQNKMFVDACLDKNKIKHPAATIDDAIKAMKLIIKLKP